MDNALFQFFFPLFPSKLICANVPLPVRLTELIAWLYRVPRSIAPSVAAPDSTDSPSVLIRMSTPKSPMNPFGRSDGSLRSAADLRLFDSAVILLVTPAIAGLPTRRFKMLFFISNAEKVAEELAQSVCFRLHCRTGYCCKS